MKNINVDDLVGRALNTAVAYRKREKLKTLFTATVTFAVMILTIVGFSLFCGCASAPTPRPARTVRPKLMVAEAPPLPETMSPYAHPETLDPFATSERRERLVAVFPQMPKMQDVGFVYRPPRGFERGNPRSHTIINDTKFAARIFMDGREILQTMAGSVARTPVMYNGSIHFLALLPPDAPLYNVGDSDEHILQVELYAGPAPLLYAMTCQIDVNFLKQQNVYLAYRSCHKGNPSP